MKSYEFLHWLTPYIRGPKSKMNLATVGHDVHQEESEEKFPRSITKKSEEMIFQLVKRKKRGYARQIKAQKSEEL